MLFFALSGQSGWLTIGFASLATGALGKWTWERGMKAAPSGWKVATIVMMALQLGLVCLGAGARL